MNAVNEGGCRAEFQPSIDPANTIRDGGCAVMLERRGPYLLANDNARCGGNNVRFVGIYIRRRRAERIPAMPRFPFGRRGLFLFRSG